jgi:hypothetical protein
MRKKSIIILLGSCLLAWVLPVTGSIAQGNVNGIYRTAEDFKMNILMDPFPTDLENRIEQQLGKDLLVYRKGEVKKYKFGSVYGYYQDGVKYRAWKKRKWFSDYGLYKLLDDSGIQLYSKRSAHHRSNGYTWYYYSKTPAGEIKRFTKGNIESDFPAYPEFVQAVSEVLDCNKGNLGTDSTRQLIIQYFREKVKPEG